MRNRRDEPRTHELAYSCIAHNEDTLHAVDLTEINMAKQISPKLNALKTGAYARDVLLPWESVAAFDKLRADIINDSRPQGAIENSIVTSLVENRWQRERLRQTTAIAMHRHPFGRALEESAPKSWQDALSTVREGNIEHNKTLAKVATSIDQIVTMALHLKKRGEACESGQVEKLVQKMVEGCHSAIKVLSRIETALDEEREFFEEYSLRHLEQRLRLECSLDAQFDKLCARLVIAQEARILKLRKIQESPGASPLVHDKGDEAGASEATMTERDLCDADRDDDEFDPPEKQDERDPFEEYIAENDDE